jgi:hypothetical protein
VHTQKNNDRKAARKIWDLEGAAVCCHMVIVALLAQVDMESSLDHSLHMDLICLHRPYYFALAHATVSHTDRMPDWADWLRLAAVFEQLLPIFEVLWRQKDIRHPDH